MRRAWVINHFLILLILFQSTNFAFAGDPFPEWVNTIGGFALNVEYKASQYIGDHPAVVGATLAIAGAIMVTRMVTNKAPEFVAYEAYSVAIQQMYSNLHQVQQKRLDQVKGACGPAVELLVLIDFPHVQTSDLRSKGAKCIDAVELYRARVSEMAKNQPLSDHIQVSSVQMKAGLPFETGAAPSKLPFAKNAVEQFSP